jgi:hypothetical protein
MVGWKVALVLGTGYASLFPRLRENSLPYHMGTPTSSSTAPLFFFGDAVRGAEIALRMNSAATMALLCVETGGTVRTLRYCADEEGAIAEFWATILAKKEWPLTRSFACWPHTHVADTLTPVAVAWQGQRQGDAAQLAAALQAGMDAVRGEVQAKPSLWFPTISR